MPCLCSGTSITYFIAPIHTSAVASSHHSTAPTVTLLIQWQNERAAAVTWEFADTIRHQFPSFSLEGKEVGRGYLIQTKLMVRRVFVEDAQWQTVDAETRN